MVSNPIHGLTEQEYLAIERAAEFKSEFLNGEMFAMAGCSLQHARLASNVNAELNMRLRGGSCEAFTSDFRVRVSATGLYTYPDASVVCGPPALADSHKDTLLNPVAIFEVLSPSTEAYDRGKKFQHYRTIESLRHYILVEQDRLRVEHYSLQADNTWSLRDYLRPEDELAIETIGVSIPLATLYERVEFEA